MAAIVAPIGLMAGRRRRLRLGHALDTIHDLLILSYRVEPETLRRILPCRLEPYREDGSAWVSALLFKNRRLRPARLGFPRLACNQLNLRSYVVDPIDGRAGSVFFHGMHPSRGWLSWITRHAVGLPSRHVPLEVSVARAGDGRLHWQATTPDGSLQVSAREQPEAIAIQPSLLDLLTNVHTGYVPRGRHGGLGRFGCWHLNQTVVPMAVETATIPPLGELGVELGAPASALYVAEVDYEMYLPVRDARTARGASGSTAGFR